MTDARRHPDPAPLDLGRFRPYLRLLAGLAISVRWLRRFDASDVVQDTLMKAHCNQADLRGRADGEVAAWLRTELMHNVDHAKRDNSRQCRDIGREVPIETVIDLSSRLLLKILPATGSTPSDKVMREERVVRLAAMLESLSEAQREAVVLRYLRELPGREVAQHMGCTPAAVASLARHGLARLRELAAEENGV
jgi:RNA polymerase sigma-70 factor (ECF subfamily)